jgi:CRISPR type IV-associated protein Csf3
MRPLRVIAHTPAGFASADPWSPALDGILGYYLMRERLGEEQFALSQSDPTTLAPLEDLPLGREAYDDLWWWQVSAPRYQEQGQHRRYYHRRFDLDLATRYLPADHKGRISVKGGPYKNYRNVRDIHITPRVEWHAIGDAGEILRLLTFASGEPRCTHVGAGSAQGLGRVVRWEVVEDGDEELARFCRPLPAEFAAAHGRSGILLEWGYRPPGRLPANRALCVMPLAEPESKGA